MRARSRRTLAVAAAVLLAAVGGGAALWWLGADTELVFAADEWLRADPATGAVVPTPSPPASQRQLGPSTLEDVRGDGSRFLVATAAGRRVVAADLLVAPRPGARARAVLPRALGTPAFSPDATRLVAVQATDPDTPEVSLPTDAPARLVVARADGHGRPWPVPGTEDAQSFAPPPVWTDDGRIVYVARRGVVVLRDGARGRSRTVLAPGRAAEHLAVSPDATHATFLLVDRREPALAVARLDGHGPLTVLPHAWTGAFSPGGHRLAVSHGDRVDVMTADGRRRLRALPATGGNRSISPITWTPDGHALLYHAVPPSPPD